MKKITIISIIVLMFAFASCKKEPLGTPKVDAMEKLTVPSSFNWKTTKEIQIKLTAKVNGLAEVVSPQGVAYQKVYLMPNRDYMMKLTVPAYEKTVRAKFMGQDIAINLETTNISIAF